MNTGGTPNLSHPGGAGKVLHPLYAVRLWRMSSQLVFPLYMAVVDALQAKPGDLVLVRVHLPYVTFRIANPELSLPVPQFQPWELPPTYRDLIAEILKAIR